MLLNEYSFMYFAISELRCVFRVRDLSSGIKALRYKNKKLTKRQASAINAWKWSDNVINVFVINVIYTCVFPLYYFRSEWHSSYESQKKIAKKKKFLFSFYLSSLFLKSAIAMNVVKVLMTLVLYFHAFMRLTWFLARNKHTISVSVAIHTSAQ